jgi:outer membrane protein OmpA-like peptidoglycan-associated protein
MIRLRGIVLTLAVALAASLGFSQTSGSGTTSTSTSTNVINATVVSAGGATSHQLVQATPGPIPGMFPGNAMGPGACYPYHPKIKNLKYLTSPSIDAMAKGVKLPRGVKPTPIDPDAAKATSYNGPIGVMEYDPTGDTINDGDIALAGITLPGKPFEINEALLGAATKALKKIAPATQRIAVFNCYIFSEVTDTSSKGLGAVASGTNGTGQIGESASIGWFKGKSLSEQQRYVVTTVYAMNGPYNLLTPPTPESKRDDAAAKPQPPIPPPVKVEAPIPPPPTPTAVTVIMPTPSPVASCAFPDFTIHFARIKQTIVEGEELKKLAPAANWLKAHPSCMAQVEGHACAKGSYERNAVLGRERAKNVYEALISLGVKEDQLIQFVSVSKEKKSTEYNNDDRRAILRSVGDASGR